MQQKQAFFRLIICEIGVRQAPRIPSYQVRVKNQFTRPWWMKLSLILSARSVVPLRIFEIPIHLINESGENE